MGKDFEYYERDGRKYERVSTILDYFPSPGLIDWKVRVGKRESGAVSRKALKIGTIVDGYCEDDVNGKGYSVKKKDTEEVRSCMRAWEEWKRDYPGVFSGLNQTQERVFFNDWGVAGTCDLLSPTVLIDVKTSKRVSLAYWVQLAVYNREFKRAEKRVLCLSKELGTYEYVECPAEYSQEYLEQVFVGMLNVYRYFKSEKQEESDAL